MSKVEVLSKTQALHRLRRMAGFNTTDPGTPAFNAMREFLENSLDACEQGEILPVIKIDVKDVKNNNIQFTCYDNGIGMTKENVLKAFGTMFSSSKYSNRQSRGLFGIGGKVFISEGQITTDRNFTVVSATEKDKKILTYTLRIDQEKDIANIIKIKESDNTKKWHGTIIRFYLSKNEVSFKKAQNRIETYLERCYITSPYAKITYSYNDKETKILKLIDKAPTPAKIVPYHPKSIEPYTLKNLLLNSKKKDILSFLTAMQSVGEMTAKNFLTKYKIKPNIVPNKIDYMMLSKAMKEYEKWLAPSTDCLSLIGEKDFITGVKHLYNPEFVSYSNRKDVFIGIPFAIETVIAMGGDIPKRQIRLKLSKEEFIKIFRFANRIPLIDEYKSCLIYQATTGINWASYGIDPTKTPTMVFVHICTTGKTVLFKDLGKGMIISDLPDIFRTITLALQAALRKARGWMGKRKQREAAARRKGIFELYSPLIATSLATMTEKDEEEINEMIRSRLQK